jgi:hypothetical protein
LLGENECVLAEKIRLFEQGQQRLFLFELRESAFEIVYLFVEMKLQIIEFKAMLELDKFMPQVLDSSELSVRVALGRTVFEAFRVLA